MTEESLRTVGLNGWLVELGSAGEAASLFRYFSSVRDQGKSLNIVDLIPGAQTLLIDCDRPGLTQRMLRELMSDWREKALPAPRTDSSIIEIPVRYNGPDLEAVARLARWSEARVIEEHCTADLTVAFCGFTPGFAYITGLPPALHVARLPEPRAVVPAGAVALAGGYTGVYPRRSPGGWQIIGHTSASVWNQHRDPPALLTPGTRVRFVRVRS